MPLTNKVALITGASRGIGRAILDGLAQQGATVIGTATTAAGAQAISDYLAEKKWPGFGMVLNVSDVDSINTLFNQLSEMHPTGPHILVNNAGITRDGLLLRMSDDDWMDVIQTNLTGIFRLTKLCIRPMIKARWGRIINISSLSGVMGNAGQSNYAAAKAGVLGFSKSLAQEIASRGVTVNVVAPGYIRTDMTEVLNDEIKARAVEHIPAKRFGEPEEIAAAVSFLASPQASYVTGTTIHVNGGIYMV